MPLPSTYSVGTVTAAANEVSVTGTGTNFLLGGIRAGDVLAVKGLTVTIASVESETALTLAFPWPGAAQTTQPYEIRYIGDPSRVLAATSQVLAAIESGGGSADLSGVVRFDIQQGLSAVERSRASTNIGVGNPETNFLTVYTSARDL